MREKKLPIVFSCDENYAPYLPVAVQSLVDNAVSARSYEIIIMDCSSEGAAAVLAEALAEIRGIIAAAERADFSLRCIGLRRLLERNNFLQENRQALKRYGIGTYARLFIPDILADYDKVLYLDIDHIILGDAADLFAFPLGGRLVAAVPDINAAQARLLPQSQRKQLIEQKLKLAAEDCYIITSPILFNIPACRAFGFTEKVLAVLARIRDLPFPDQDAINAVCKGRIFYLPLSWGRANIRNFAKICRFIRKKAAPKQIETIFGDGSAERGAAALIHYVAAPKPWSGVESDYAALWWHYAAKTKRGGDLLFALLFPLAAAAPHGEFGFVTAYKLFGLPLWTVKTFLQEKQYYFGKLPVAKQKQGKKNRYIYFFGLKIFTIDKRKLQKNS